MLAVAALTLLLALTQYGGAQNDECLCFEEISSVNDLQSPLIFEHANDGTNRRFIGEQTGLCWIVMPNGTRLPEPFLNISELVYQGSGYSEEGFLSLAFHPQFITNRKLYVYYSYRVNNAPITRLTEMLTFQSDPNKVDKSTARNLMTIPQPYTNHNGGRLMFGLDNYLYLMLGDGGSAGDPENNAQNMTTWLGKALRIDVNTRATGKEYGIPPDNPFVGDPIALEEIYASGFRNPWRVHQDTGDRITGEGRGRIFIGDVGQNAYEEVDILVPVTDAAANYGWSAYEGYSCYDQARCDAIAGTPLIFPIHAYDHNSVGVCVIGGPVYRGTRYPFLNGVNFFGDWGSGKIFYLTDDAGVWTPHEVSSCPSGNDCVTYCDPGTCSGALSSTFTGQFILTFGVDEAGEIYFGTSSSQLASSRSGRVYKIHDLRGTRKNK